jgi:hypothetical protein
MPILLDEYACRVWRFVEKEVGRLGIVRVCMLIAVCLASGCVGSESPPEEAGRIDIDVSACYGTAKLLEGMRAGADEQAVREELERLMNTRAYKTMFKHYNRDWRPNHLPEDVFERMILSLRFDGMYAEGESRRADQMFPKWRDYYRHPEKYAAHLEELEAIDFDEIVNRSMATAASWLPPEMTIDDFYLFVHPNGGSPGFVIDGTQGYDFFQLPRDSAGNVDAETFGEIVAHECHHLGLETPPIPRNSAADSVAFQFLQVFVGEGTANKFINNCGGGAVPRIDGDRANTIMDPGTNDMTRELWEQYTRDESDIFEKLVETFNRAADGDLPEAELKDEMAGYWITGMMPRNYFVGSEIFGAIYFGFGKEGCFDVMRDPRKMFDYYNRALEKRPDVLSGCPRIPGAAAARALSIGDGSLN